MHRIRLLLIVLLSPLMLLLGSSRAVAASNGVRDEAHFFSAQAISEAEQTIQQIEDRHHRDVLVETFAQIPQSVRDRFPQSPDFWKQWATSRARESGDTGVYILVCKNPTHLYVETRNDVQRSLFTAQDTQQLIRDLTTAFRNRQFDEGLTSGMQFIQRQMDAHGGRGSAGTSAMPSVPGTPAPNTPGPSFPSGSQRGWGVGGLACVIIGVVLLIMLVRGVFGRSGRGYYGGPGYPPQGGGYPPAGYPPAGGYGYGGGGGGFGRGFLGGLLGGALGGYAADRWLGHGQQGGGYAPPPSGGAPDAGSSADTGWSGGGADFGSQDTGGSGADFGSQDAGGGGADFGGGGGDSGGGGGDFGGGDSGGSGGGDF